MLANELFRDFNLPRNHVAEALKDAERYGLAIRVKRRLMLVPSAILPYLMKKKTVPQLSTQKCSDPISSPSVQSQSASQMDSQKENDIPAGRKRKLANDGQENHDDRSENKPSLLQQKINNGELQLSQSTDDDDFTTVSGGQRGHSAVKRRKTSVIKEPMRQIAEEGE